MSLSRNTTIYPNTMLPSQSFSLSLWNANGLRATTIHGVLSHVLSTDILLITETWLTSGFLPVNWSQYHLYGAKVANAHNRGSGGISALVSPYCPYPVTQLASPNAHTLSLKIGTITVHCVYFSPRLSRDLVLHCLRSLPLNHDTILCGDFNARLGSLTGDAITTPRGTDFKAWIDERGLSLLNGSLAYGIPTFSTFRRETVLSSIIDLFLTNIPLTGMVSPGITVETELSLGSDHRLLTLSFDYVPLLGSGDNVGITMDNISGYGATGNATSSGNGNAGVASRRLWNLSRLTEEGPLNLYRDKFRLLVIPLNRSLTSLVAHPPLNRPAIDDLNDQLNQCLYQSLDKSIGTKKNKPSHWWKKYWTEDIEQAAKTRDSCYSKWRHTLGSEKSYWWAQHQAAHRVFRRLVSKAKRLSWKNFCASLEHDLTKATATLARTKRRRQTAATYAHPDGPKASVDTMACHLSTVYNGSLLSSASRPAPPLDFDHLLPFSVADTDADLFAPATLLYHIKCLPRRKAPGPDHLKAEMLKAISKDLSETLSLLFQLCYHWAYSPKLWRIAHVFPIHKKGDASNPANYRPISLTSVMRKLFESTLSPCLQAHSPPLDIAQGGFRPQRSPLDQAL